MNTTRFLTIHHESLSDFSQYHAGLTVDNESYQSSVSIVKVARLQCVLWKLPELDEYHADLTIDNESY